MYDLKRGFNDVMYIYIPGPLNFQIHHKSAVDYPESYTFITRAEQRSKALFLNELPR
jgi:hypothetical protein